MNRNIEIDTKIKIAGQFIEMGLHHASSKQLISELINRGFVKIDNGVIGMKFKVSVVDSVTDELTLGEFTKEIQDEIEKSTSVILINKALLGE